MGEGFEARLMLIRHVLAIVILPVTVTVLVPFWLARRNGVTLAAGVSSAELAIQFAGLLLLATGLLFFASSLRRFASDGKGTLAPWDPPRALVVRGPYRYVRNPMISGVILVLAGEACLLLSRSHTQWAATFFVINAIYIPLIEEPMLEQRFGEPYREYCRHVGRLIPRIRPWQPAAGEPTTDRPA
jgi:protein-S-isoprenylcysteine O-methyltransferase Ste14